MSASQTVQTEHGAVEYETVDCSYCESTVVPDDAVDVVLGEAVGTWSAHSEGNFPKHRGVAAFDHDEWPAMRKICADCAEAAFDYTGGSGVDADIGSGAKPSESDEFDSDWLMVILVLFSGFAMGAIVGSPL